MNFERITTMQKTIKIRRNPIGNYFFITVRHDDIEDPELSGYFILRGHRFYSVEQAEIFAAENNMIIAAE